MTRSNDPRMDELSARLVGVLSDPATPSTVGTYLATYTGGFFESIGDGGDGPESRDRVTAEDLVAVQMLSVTTPQPLPPPSCSANWARSFRPN